MTEPESHHLTERAADDLLLLLAQVETSDVPLPSPEAVLGVLGSHLGECTNALTAYARRGVGNKQQRQRDMDFAFSAATDALIAPATGHLLLSIALLTWAAERTGLTHAEVVAEVLARTEPEGTV